MCDTRPIPALLSAYNDNEPFLWKDFMDWQVLPVQDWIAALTF